MGLALAIPTLLNWYLLYTGDWRQAPMCLNLLANCEGASAKCGKTRARASGLQPQLTAPSSFSKLTDSWLMTILTQGLTNYKRLFLHPANIHPGPLSYDGPAMYSPDLTINRHLSK
jgi:hypothetical protein